MALRPPRVRKFSTAVGDDAIRFSDGIHITPALNTNEGVPMTAYTSFLRAGARADLPAPNAEVWVVLSGAIRVGDASATEAVQAGEFVYVPEHSPGIVEAIEDTTMVCLSPRALVPPLPPPPSPPSPRPRASRAPPPPLLEGGEGAGG